MGKRYYWLKLPEDFFRSKVIKKLRRIAGGDTYTLIYMKMLLLSIKQDGKLYYDGVEESFAEELALELDEEAENVKVTLQFLASQGMMLKGEDNDYLLPECVKMIGSETSAAEKMRELRKNRNNQKTISNTDITQCNNVTECYIDIDNHISQEVDNSNKSEKKREKAADTNVSVCQTQSVRREQVDRITDAWNSLSDVGVKPISRIVVESTRYRNLSARIRQYGVDKVIEAIERVPRSNFLLGQVKDWSINFDWFVKPNNFIKVLDGNYDNDNQKQRGGDIYAGIREWNNGNTVDAVSSSVEDSVSAGGIPSDW